MGRCAAPAASGCVHVRSRMMRGTKWLSRVIRGRTNENDRIRGNLLRQRAKALVRQTPQRFGVIWASTHNIGDDVQTLAAINLLKKQGVSEEEIVLIDRERLSLYDGPPVRVIMNGWYSHNLNMFEPPANIYPTFISFHVNDLRLISRYKEYFQKHAPIGCRDEATVEHFKAAGIDAYFSGCLTLTFDESVEPREGTYLVDMPPGVDYLEYHGNNLKPWASSTKVAHEFDEGDPMRFQPQVRLKFAQQVLDQYRRAELVLTTRLHCGLPCRAFNTDMVFINAAYERDPRFAGLRPYLGGYDGGEPGSDIAMQYRTVDRDMVNQLKRDLNQRVAEFIQ